MAATAQSKQHALRVARQLAEMYPDAQCSLRFRSPWQLLVATILSAQCTDERVNMVTPGLFKKYKSPASFAAADPDELAADIRSTGFFRSKAKNIQGAARAVVDEHGGKVPRDLDALVKLPGVGRKTANVVLGTAYGVAVGVVVDTHVTRLSRRLGLTKQADPVKIERDLMARLPESEWIDISHRLIQHGRRICTARKPRCPECPLLDICPQVGIEKPKTAARRTSA